MLRNKKKRSIELHREVGFFCRVMSFPAVRIVEFVIVAQQLLTSMSSQYSRLYLEKPELEGGCSFELRSGGLLVCSYWHLYLRVLLSMPPVSFYKNRIFKDSWHEAEVGGYSPIEGIVSYI